MQGSTVIRTLDVLEPQFRSRLQLWLSLAERNYLIRVTETYRSLARQRMLVASGLSRTMQSRHLVGKAADIVIIRADGSADWRPSSYRELYRRHPLAPHGLRTIDTPGFVDLVHIECLRP